MTTTTETYQEKYARAKARVNEIRYFYNHVAVYLLINAALAGLNYWENQFAFPWFLFPLLGWGIGLLSHAVGTFRLNPFVSKEWEERKLREIMEQQDKS
ncbi:2TM domain-containing protein [Nonlabens ponticola]|uniref:2TM domain-containing protein n=1 Tax=Nonlabens ponticola TaxID=2496866 RepID=A0A3S9MY14_9FLAO|nr:2TM domain-containing protein [Nonlabens ponticola]AZQ44141.1 2TM domain-containing protein [Nonlabens ponticola]